MERSIGIWGDSILKGLVLQPARTRYTLLKKDDAVSLVQQQLQIPVQNHCRIGINSKKGLEVLDQYIDTYKEGDIALLCFGGNDSDFNWKAIAETPAEEHRSQVTTEHFKNNILAMLKKIRGRKMIPVLATLPPIDSERYFQWVSRDIEKKNNILQWLGDVDRIFRYHGQYSKIISEIAKELKIRLIHLRTAFLSNENYRDLLCADGIHPNAQGHRQMAKEMMRFIEYNGSKEKLFGPSLATAQTI